MIVILLWFPYQGLVHDPVRPVCLQHSGSEYRPEPAGAHQSGHPAQSKYDVIQYPCTLPRVSMMSYNIFTPCPESVRCHKVPLHPA